MDDFTTEWVLSAGYACDSILLGKKTATMQQDGLDLDTYHGVAI